MKVLIITPGYLMVPAINGGAIEGLVDTIVKENEIYDKADFTVFSINDGTKFNNPIYKNTKYVYIDTTTKKYKIKRAILGVLNKIPNFYMGKAYIREICKILDKEGSNYDLVIIENNPIFSNIVTKHVNCPIVLHLHNDYLNCSSKLSNSTLRNFTKVMTVSDYIGNKVMTIDDNKDKIRTLYNGIDLKKFDRDISYSEKINLRKKYKLDDKDFVILYTGRIMKEKGVKELIEAFNNLKREDNNFKLLIVGSSFFNNAKISSYQKELLILCQQFKDDIIFTGYIEHEHIVDLYKISDVQVVPSLWGEPLATTVIEGMASKIPLIVNNVGGIPEMVDENSALFCQTNSLVYDIEKNIKEIYENKNNLREKLTNEAYEMVKKFEKTIFYNNYIEILKEILKEERLNGR